MGIENLIGGLRGRLHRASRFSIVCQSVANACAAGELPAN
jgi:hypothetical protein